MGEYAPTRESLTRYRVPAWYEDAKLGIYCHWGPYAVPAFGNEWYSRTMYERGTAAFAHHVAAFGPVSRFGYKDFIPAFRGEKFDPEEWADLFVRAGARFAGPVAEHADGFALWDSTVNPWNAARMGPRRDVVAALASAVRARGLRFMASFHHQWLWGWYALAGPDADARDPAHASFYGPSLPPTAAAYPDPVPLPDPAFCAAWRDKVLEVVDAHAPDLIYFDSRTRIIAEPYRLAVMAAHYNRAAEPVLTFKQEDFPAGTGVRDVEAGRLARDPGVAWQTDDLTDWRSWGYVASPEYKTPARIIHELADVVSKRGVLLLNAGPRADGTFPGPLRDLLLALGGWLAINGEAIYGTRPWAVFGEGPTAVTEGELNERDNPDFTPRDIRFTAKEGVLYAIVLGLPGPEIRIASLAAGRFAVRSVTMLGCPERLVWRQDDGALVVARPRTLPGDHAVTLKVERAA